jgi:ATP adenylyltransferase
MGYWENQSKTYKRNNYSDDVWSPNKASDSPFYCRNFITRGTDSICQFCWGNARTRLFEIYDSVFAIFDEHSVTEGHLLILTKRHTEDYFSMTTKERIDCDNMIRILRKRISKDDQTVTRFNIGINSGKSAGQTIFHAHIHLIPRRDGDTPNPRGGIRGVIPDKMDY